MMKHFKKIIAFGTLILLIFFCASVFVKAADINDDSYTLLAPLPGTNNCSEDITDVSGVNPDQYNPIELNSDSGTSGGCKTNLDTYIPGMFNLFIAVAAVMAFGAITYGGVLYMTSDSINQTDKGKKHIQDAIWGLVLVIGSYVILYTINPDLLKLNFNNIPEPQTIGDTSSGSVGGSGTSPTTILSPQDYLADNALRATLSSEGIAVNAPACTSNQPGQSCTDVVGLTTNTQNGLETISEALGCGASTNAQPLTSGTQNCLTITGGTEGGHAVNSDHNDGTAVDLAPGDKLTALVTQGQPLVSGKSYTYTNPDGTSATFTWEPKGCCGTATAPASTNDHWHTTFN